MCQIAGLSVSPLSWLLSNEASPAASRSWSVISPSLCVHSAPITAVQCAAIFMHALKTSPRRLHASMRVLKGRCFSARARVSTMKRYSCRIQPNSRMKKWKVSGKYNETVDEEKRTDVLSQFDLWSKTGQVFIQQSCTLVLFLVRCTSLLTVVQTWF